MKITVVLSPLMQFNMTSEKYKHFQNMLIHLGLEMSIHLVWNAKHKKNTHKKNAGISI